MKTIPILKELRPIDPKAAHVTSSSPSQVLTGVGRGLSVRGRQEDNESDGNDGPL